jgi:hypothetical protein
MKRDKNGDFYVKIKLNEAIAEWYQTLPARSKSLEVSYAISMGIPLCGESLYHLQNLIQELAGRIAELENVNTTMQLAQIGQNCRIEAIHELLMNQVASASALNSD